MDRSRARKRVTVAEAAEALGVSKDAVRARIKRGTIDHERDEAGSVFVYVPWGDDQDADQGDDANADQPTDHADQGGQDRVERELRAQVEMLRDQLQAEREANRENRRLLAAALEHVRALEPPREPPGDPETDAEEPARGKGPETPAEPAERRSWWRRYFGFE